MITPFEVYLVMQLDTITTAAGLFGFAATCVGGFVMVVGFCEDETWAKWLGSTVFSLGLFCLLLATFLPSTKTAAAMIVLPAITSDEVVKPLGDEARGLYDLAKQALKKAVDAPVTEPKVEKSDDE
jgi:hypothetical protein